MFNSGVDILLKLDGIDGQSAVRGHEKDIDVLSYEQALDVTVLVSGDGSGATAVKSEFSGVRLRKLVDVASVPMQLACASGQHLHEARFAFRRKDALFDFYFVTLQDVLITHMTERGGVGSQYPLAFDTLSAGAASSGLLDEATLNFSRILWEYRTQDQKGSITTAASGGWDVRTGKKI